MIYDNSEINQCNSKDSFCENLLNINVCLLILKKVYNFTMLIQQCLCKNVYSTMFIQQYLFNNVYSTMFIRQCLFNNVYSTLFIQQCFLKHFIFV